MAVSKHQLSKQLSGHYSKALKNDACLETWHRSCLNNPVGTVRAHDGPWKHHWIGALKQKKMKWMKCFDERNFLSLADVLKQEVGVGHIKVLVLVFE